MTLIMVLLVSGALVVATVAVHFFGIVALLAMLPGSGTALRPPQHILRQAGVIMVIVLGLIGLHAVEIWIYALAFILLGEFATLEAALYFSTATFSTAGFGDVVMESDWRLLSAVESVNGFVLIGWSTAVLVQVISRVRDLERELKDGGGDES